MNIDEAVLHLMTAMCQQSLDPESYEAYEKIHDMLIDVRNLNILKFEPSLVFGNEVESKNGQ